MNFKVLSKKQIIILLIVCLIVLIVLNKFIVSISKGDNEDIVSYKEDTGATLVRRASVEYDRVICYNVENFVKQYIDSFDDRYEKSTYANYYKKSVTDEYKASNSKSKYKKQAENFYSKIIEYSTVDTKRGEQLVTEKSLYNQDMIDKIYRLEEDYYICTLKLKDDEISYLGLNFSSNDDKAYIFYIE